MEMMNAGLIMQNYVGDGWYDRKKRNSNEIEQHRKLVRKGLEDSELRRHVYENHNVVAKFIRKNVYKVDEVGLNEFLYNIGLLHELVSLKSTVVKEHPGLSEFQIPLPQILGVSYNKKAKFEMDEVDYVDIETHLQAFTQAKEIEVSHIERYEELKERIMLCPILKEKKKITHEFGSVYLKDNHHKQYDIQAIIKEYGVDFMIENGKPHFTKISEFIERGTIRAADINSFREVVDIRLDFVIMNLDAEERMFEALNHKRNNTLKNMVS